MRMSRAEGHVAPAQRSKRRPAACCSRRPSTVFRRRGFAGATVEEITERAGFSRGAFYSNFDSREQLFIELLHNRVYDEFTRMLQRTPRKKTARADEVDCARVRRAL